MTRVTCCEVYVAVSVAESPKITAALVRNDFLLRRLHSLTGVIPVGAFLIEHLLTNSGAWYGAARFNKDVKWIQDLPFLFVLEWGTIFLPLAFHSLFGLWLALLGRPNAATYPYLNNVRYTLQRVTAYITLVFLVVHLMKYRFAWLLGGPVFAESKDWFALTQQGMLHWHIGSLYVPAWITIPMYIVGLTAACYHFGNGLWTFGITWGFLGGPNSQKLFTYVCLGAAIALCVLGYLSLYGLVVNPPLPPGAIVPH